jgi:hypothetical protein
MDSNISVSGNLTVDQNETTMESSDETEDEPLKVGDKICVEGLVMDFFCIERGTLFDNPSVRTLEDPMRHSVHCLVDVRQCVGSPYEILLDPLPGESLFARGWRLDDATKSLVIDLAQSVGECSTCNPTVSDPIVRGLRVAINVTVLDLGSTDSPPTISGSDVRMSSVGGNECGNSIPGTSTNAAGQYAQQARPPIYITGSGSNLQRKYNAHASLMLIAWGWLLPTGAVFARLFKHRPSWYHIHMSLQVCGLALALVGWIIALRNFSVFEMGMVENTYRHGVLGSATMTLGLLQPLNAVLRPHAPSTFGETKTKARVVWETLHKTTGYVVLILSVVTIGYGTVIRSKAVSDCVWVGCRPLWHCDSYFFAT